MPNDTNDAPTTELHGVPTIEVSSDNDAESIRQATEMLGVRQRAEEVQRNIERGILEMSLDTPIRDIQPTRDELTRRLTDHMAGILSRDTLYRDMFTTTPMYSPSNGRFTEENRPRPRPDPPMHRGLQPFDTIWIDINEDHGARSLANRIIEDYRRDVMIEMNRRFAGTTLTRDGAERHREWIRSNYPQMRVRSIEPNRNGTLEIDARHRLSWCFARGEEIVRDQIRQLAREGVRFADVSDVMARYIDVVVNRQFHNDSLVVSMQFGRRHEAQRWNFTIDRHEHEREYRSRRVEPPRRFEDEFHIRPSVRDFERVSREQELRLTPPRWTVRMDGRDLDVETVTIHHGADGSRMTGVARPQEESRATRTSRDRISGRRADAVIIDDVMPTINVEAPRVTVRDEGHYGAPSPGGHTHTIEAVMPAPAPEEDADPHGGDEIDLMAAGIMPRPLEEPEPVEPITDPAVEAATLMVFITELVPLLSEAMAEVSPEHMLRAELECSLAETKAMLARCTRRVSGTGAPVTTNNPWGGRSRVRSADAA